MSDSNNKITIKDIAAKAGVSQGTVDRVLHNRGNVSEETKKKIEQILHDIQYTPNVYASALASRKTFTFIAVIPDYGPGDYWEKVESGIRKEASELSDFKVNINILNYCQFDVDSFCKVMEQVLGQAPDGVLIVPSIRSVTYDFTVKFDRLNIPYVFIDSNVEESNYLAYYGQHSYQSGYLAAKLLLTQKPDINEIAVFSFYHIGQKPSNQISLRMSGFSSYVLEKKNSSKLHRAALEVGNTGHNEKVIHQLLLQNPNIEGAVIISSRSFAAAEFFDKYKLSQIPLIGFDLLEENVRYLKKNVISYLIAQRPEEQGFKGIKALSDHILFKKPVSRINYTPIDILTQENIDFYSETV